MSDLDLDELYDELREFAQPDKQGGRSPRQERIIAGFEEIQRFFDQQGRPPSHAETGDIFERIYAVCLDRMRALQECRSVLEPVDHQGLLGPGQEAGSVGLEVIDDDDLFAELADFSDSSDLTELTHVRPSAEKVAAEEIANRQRRTDFDTFKPLFEKVQRELASGIRQSRPFRDDATIEKGNWFILGGQKAYIAEEGDEFVAEYGRKDRRLRVIFDNGTESTMLKRSVERGLHKDEAGRRITDPDAGPLFSDQHEKDDHASGTIYMLRSKSDHPMVVENRQLVHKIGVTNASVDQRIARARLQPTFLLADVEVVATYELFNINRTKLENIIHRVFGRAQLEVEIIDRFGNPFMPREWFLVPLFVIDEVVSRIRDGTIVDYSYDPEKAALVQLKSLA